MKTALREGQCVQHASFGIGIATRCTEARTTIDFYDHGTKLFVTELLEVDLVSEAPPRPRGSKARAKRDKADPPAPPKR